MNSAPFSPSQLAALPTETVWGLAAYPTPAGLRRLREAKRRSPDKAFQVSSSTPALALALAQPSRWLEVLSEGWPGPLTVVTPAAPDCEAFLAPGGLVGLRVPSHPVSQSVLDACGGRLVTSSLNVSGEPTVRTEAQARSSGLADVVIPDAGLAPAGAPSTVLRVIGDDITVLRAGLLELPDLLASLRRAGWQGHWQAT